MALIVVLAIMVIATVVTLSYLLMMREEKVSSGYYVDSMKTAALLEDAQKLVLGELRQEIRQGSRIVLTAKGTEIFLPATSSLSQPAAIRTPQESTKPTSGPGLLNLIRRSASQSFSNSLPLSHTEYPFTANPFRLAGSEAPTSSPSRNGRYLNADRWNKPQMMAKSSLPNFRVPDWIYLTRGGPLIFTSPTAATQLDGKAITASPNDPDLANSTFVTGRFAYVMYRADNGFDITAAGLPSVSSPIPVDQSRHRRSMPFAHLSAVPGMTSGLVDSIVNFRNSETKKTLYKSAESSAPDTFFGWATHPLHGFLNPAPGDQKLLTRQELIRFWESNGGNIELLPYLTVFSRELNAPSFVPDPDRPKVNSTEDDFYNPPFPQAVFPVSGTIPRDATLQAGFAVNQGDPMVQRRFALQRLRWLTPEGPSASLPLGHASNHAGGTPENILRYFGLTWDNSNLRWIYDHGNPDEIMALVPGTPYQDLHTYFSNNPQALREPDFFELLKAGLTHGSLGVDGDKGTTQDAASGAATNLDLHVLQIGANIIDQGRSDNFPTEIVYRNGQSTVADGPSVYGIKDLPYLVKLYPLMLRREGDPITSLHAYFLPELYRPHYSEGPMPNGPTDFRILIAEGSRVNLSTSLLVEQTAGDPTQYSVQYRQGFGGALTGTDRIFSASDSAASAVYFTGTSDPNYWRTPMMLLDTNSTASGLNVVNLGSGAVNVPLSPATQPKAGEAARTKGLKSSINTTLGRTDPYPTWNMVHIDTLTLPIPADTPPEKLVINYPEFTKPAAGAYPSTLLTIQLQYRKGTQWKTYREYKTLSRNYFFKDDGPWMGNGSWWYPNVITLDGAWHYAWVDPRTDRFGSSAYINSYNAYGSNQGVEGRGLHFPDYGPGGYPFNKKPGNVAAHYPTGPNFYINLAAASNKINPVISAVNKPGSSGEFSYRDPDQVMRPGDGVHSAVVAGTYSPDNQMEGNPMMNAANNPSRPLMLNRPYLSVGELGYAFRDIPWRSLNFASSGSSMNGKKSNTDHDGVLLDLFSTDETPRIRAGVINLNTPHAEVLRAFFSAENNSSIPIHDVSTAASPNATNVLTSAEIQALASASAVATTARPAQNKADIVERLVEDATVTAAYASNATRRIKPRRETIARALGDATQTRTWNLLIDLVVQSGKFPRNKPVSDLGGDFVVEGERRVWWHLAIDRYTGEIVDQEIEAIYE